MAAGKLLAILLCITASVICLPALENAENNATRNTEIENIYRLPRHVIPIHYNVQLIPHILGPSSTLDGVSKTTIEVLRETKEIVLHTNNLTIEDELSSLENTDGNIFRPNEHKYHDEAEMLHLLFNETIMPGVYTLNMTFNGLMSADMYGFYNSFYKNEGSNMVWLAATHFQPISARRVFPCWDEPALKATFKMSIKHFSNYTALSNMPLYKQEIDESDGKIWSHFETTPLMSTNILAFVIADYVNVTNEDGTIRIWTRKEVIQHAKYILDIAERATIGFEEYLNSTVRVPKMDHVSVPHYSSRATENWGLVVYQESAFIHNKEQNKAILRMYNIMTVVHEVSHQWFGNLVSPSWWKYFWMSEGLATYFKYYMTDKFYKDWRLMDLFLVNIQQEGAFVADDRYNVVPINEDVNSVVEIRHRDTSIVYRKSSSVLRMLSHILSEDVFQTGLIKYVIANEYDSVTSDDLWKAMQDALDESETSDIQVKEIMDSWIEQTGYPIVTVLRDYDKGKAIVYQKSITADKDPTPKRWWIPFNYATKSNPEFDSTSPIHWLKPNVDNITIDVNSDDWIIANIQETGYYRVNYDDRNWRKIARFLNSDEYTKIHLLNRAQIIDDAYYMLKRQKMDPVTFIHITNYLSRETDYIPWSVVFNILSMESKYLENSEGAKLLKPHIARLINNLVENTDFNESSDESEFTKISRAEILTWACTVGHSACKANATAKLVAHLNNPEQNKISPDMKYWTYCMGLMQANQTIWNKVLETCNITYDIVYYLGCSEDPVIINNYLKMSIDGQSNLWKSYSNDVASTLNYKVPSHAETLLNFVMSEWERIVAMVPQPHAILKSLLYRINTHEQLEKYKSFLLQWGIPENFGVQYRERALEKIENNVKNMRDVFLQYQNETGEMIVSENL